MDVRLFILIFLIPLPVFFFVILMQIRRGQIYRGDELVRSELNRMHRHTLWNVGLCLVLLAVAAIVPATRLYLGVPALVMLCGILPLRTIFIEQGLRYNRNGKPKNVS